MEAVADVSCDVVPIPIGTMSHSTRNGSAIGMFCPSPAIGAMRGDLGPRPISGARARSPARRDYDASRSSIVVVSVLSDTKQ